MTLGTQWSWKPNDKIKSPAEVVSILCRTVGGDGNLLLNVGPMPDGRIEPRQVEVFKQVGAWIEIPAITLPAPKPAQSGPTHLPGVSEARVKRLQDLRCGMFICWSFSTFSAKEWAPGVTNIYLFAARDCDTDQWAKAAKDAGMGYILFLRKHHDGFCLWDTQTTNRRVTKAPLGRDLLSEPAQNLGQPLVQRGAAGRQSGRRLRPELRLCRVEGTHDAVLATVRLERQWSGNRCVPCC